MNYKLCTACWVFCLRFTFQTFVSFCIHYSLFTIHTTATDDISMNVKWRYCSRYCCVNIQYINTSWISVPSNVEQLSSVYFVPFSLHLLFRFWFLGFIFLNGWRENQLIIHFNQLNFSKVIGASIHLKRYTFNVHPNSIPDRQLPVADKLYIAIIHNINLLWLTSHFVRNESIEYDHRPK